MMMLLFFISCILTCIKLKLFLKRVTTLGRPQVISFISHVQCFTCAIVTCAIFFFFAFVMLTLQCFNCVVFKWCSRSYNTFNCAMPTNAGFHLSDCHTCNVFTSSLSHLCRPAEPDAAAAAHARASPRDDLLVHALPLARRHQPPPGGRTAPPQQHQHCAPHASLRLPRWW